MWFTQPRKNHRLTSERESPRPRRLEIEALEDRLLLSANIAAGFDHTCAITAAGGVKCWGSNVVGQIGDGTTTQRPTPVDVVGLSSGVSAITAGSNHNCAVTSGGAVKCWGSGGKLGDGTRTFSTTPVDVVGLTSGIVAVVAGGGSHTCALTSDGGVKCWGLNSGGQLGDGTTINRLTPVDVLTAPGGSPLTGVVAITAGYNHTCALITTGGVECWGFNDRGQLGDGTTTAQSTPVNVSGLSTGVSAITAGLSFTCALTTSGGVKCWGQNLYGEIGDGTTLQRNTPVNVFGLSAGVVIVAAGGNHTCAVTTAGAAKCWGSNSSGELGDGSKIGFGAKKTKPVDVVGLNGTSFTVTALAAGLGHSCAPISTGGIKCWGDGQRGQLGNGVLAIQKTPVDVVGFGGGAIAAATAVRQSSPTVTGRHARAVNSIVTIPSHEDARHHTARTEAADQAIASLFGIATRRRFGRSQMLDLDRELLADLVLARQLR